MPWTTPLVPFSLQSLHPIIKFIRSFSLLDFQFHRVELWHTWQRTPGHFWSVQVLETLPWKISDSSIVMDHKNLEYFSTMKLLTWWQAHWSEFLSQFNLVIHFHPRKLGTKPDSLTRWWDIYLKEGERDYASVNLHNLHPVFTNKQLASSLCATSFYTPVLHVVKRGSGELLMRKRKKKVLLLLLLLLSLNLRSWLGRWALNHQISAESGTKTREPRGWCRV